MKRLQKNVNGNTTNFFWEGDNLSFELNQNNQPIRRYIYENGKDDVMAHVEYSEVTDPEYFSPEHKGWYSYIKDQVGTVMKVYKHETKQIVNTRTYDTFGNLINQTGSSTGKLGFQSKYFDQESGLNYYYHRYYYPKIGRFINEDPIGFSSGLNMYGFENNNPENFIDSYGLDWRDEHPDWLDLACLLWKITIESESKREEWGSWLYNDPYKMADAFNEDNWFPPVDNGACCIACKPPKGFVAGSMHTHPPFDKYGNRNTYRPEGPKDRRWANHPWHQDENGIPQPMYVISYRGINSINEKIINFKDFKCWCESRGYW
jgi:RHS repeat-associated protein